MSEIYEKILEALDKASGVENMKEIRRYAVMVPLLEEEGELKVLFQVRASKLRRQPGEICFPGGSAEEGETPEEAACRETCEELLLDPSQVQAGYRLEEVSIYSGGVLYPVVGRIDDYKDTWSSDEVDHIFKVPLRYLLETEPDFYEVELRNVPGSDFPYDRIPGGKEYRWGGQMRKLVFYRYEGYDIWGLTAGIVYQFVEGLKAGGFAL